MNTQSRICIAAACLLSWLASSSLRAQMYWNSGLGSVDNPSTVNVSYSGGSFTIYSSGGDEEADSGFLSQVSAGIQSFLNTYDYFWVSFTGIENPSSGEFELHFYAEPNATSSSRNILFGTSAHYCTVVQAAYPYNETLSFPGGTVIYPHDTTEIRINNAVPGRVYSLQEQGTHRYAGQTQFTASSSTLTLNLSLPPATYRVHNTATQAFSISYHDGFSYIFPQISARDTIPANGGRLQWDLGYYVKDGETNTFTSYSSSKLYEALNWYDDGNEQALDTLLARSASFVSSSSHSVLTVKCPPNLSPDTLVYNVGVFYEEYSLAKLVQPGGGRVLEVEPSFTAYGTAAHVSIHDTQPMVSYILFMDGVPVDTEIGNGETITLSAAITREGGKWHVRAEYRDPAGYEDHWDGPCVTYIHFSSGYKSLPLDRNWIAGRKYNGNTAPPSSDVTYYDGLGYPSQLIQLAASGYANDLVTPYTYDGLLRSTNSFLPYESDTSDDPAYVADAVGNQESFHRAEFYDSNYPYPAMAYSSDSTEFAKGGRILAKSFPGYEYHRMQHSARMSYSANQTGEVVLMHVNTDGSLTRNGYYAAGTLYGMTTVDGDGGELRTYTDRDGRPVLERRLISGDPSDTTSTCTWADTYYAYDWAGRLAWVVSPNGSAALSDTLTVQAGSTFAQRYCYYYAYDNRGNVALRTAPGVGAEQMEYDACGRLIRRQDAVMAQGGRYVAYVYDTAGRLTRETLRSEAPAATDSTVLRMYRYDTYPAALADSLAFRGISGITTGLSSRSSSTTGLLTWEKVNVLGTSGYVERAYHYDSRGNVIQVAELDPNGRVLRRSSARDLAGNITATYDSYFRPGKGDPDRIRTQYSYDSRGRKLSVARTVNGETLCTVTYSYDALGRMALKEASSAGFSESHTYDCRGWTTGSAASASGTGVFSEGLRYADPQKDTTLRRFGGGISESAVTHNGTTQGPTETYAYSYDRAGRLTGADYYAGTDVTPSDENTEKDIAYDLSGGITALKRYSLAGLSNDLHFTLDGARLVAVTDSSAVSPTSKSLTYDANGALTSDTRLGISVTNNILGLPSLITQGTRSVTFTYLADGTRTAMADAMGVAFRYAGPFVYATERVYSGGHSSLKENLHSIAWDEGRISYVEESGGGGLLLGGGSTGEAASPDAFDPGFPPIVDQRVLRDEWHVRDHLGSTRVVYNLSAASGTTIASRILEKDDYLPFGQRRFGPTNSGNRWRFSGKEEMNVSLTELGILDFGARYYDPASAHWLSPDPLREKYYGINPYTYCAGDPVDYVDVRGDSLRFTNMSAVMAICNGIAPGCNVTLIFKNGILDPNSIPSNTTDFFLQDLSEIASAETMIELSVDTKFSYIDQNGNIVPGDFGNDAPYDYDDRLDMLNSGLSDASLGKTIQGNLGQSLFPNGPFKRSTNKNIQVILNAKGTLDHQTVGSAHEFGHVLLYLRGMPYRHGDPGVDSFVYERAKKMSKRLGYDN